MHGIQRFKSFREAEAAAFDAAWEKPFDQEKVSEFFKEFSGVIGMPYKPGIYRLHSFEDAFAFDLQQYIKQAAEKEYLLRSNQKQI